MKRIILFIILLYCFSCSFSQYKAREIQAILQILHTQQDDWNKGDIESFMQASYWKSDSLQFVGKEIIYGWQNTLARYKKTYPTKDAMGHLEFSDVKVDILSDSAAFVVGAWKITHTDKSMLGGHYTLLFKKINGNWLIVTDHTS